jgi:hypothetical protein
MIFKAVHESFCKSVKNDLWTALMIFFASVSPNTLMHAMEIY